MDKELEIKQTSIRFRSVQKKEKIGLVERSISLEVKQNKTDTIKLIWDMEAMKKSNGELKLRKNNGKKMEREKGAYVFLWGQLCHFLTKITPVF